MNKLICVLLLLFIGSPALAATATVNVPITVTAASGTQTPSAIVIGGNGCSGTVCGVPNIDDVFANNVASGLPPNGTYVGTLSTTLSSGTPPFSGTYTLVAHTAGDNCGTGTINNAPFQLSSDQLQYNTGATTGTAYNVCVKATVGANSTTKEFTVTVHSIRNASAVSSGCTGTGTSVSPWNYLCIQNAVAAAALGDTVFLPGGNWALSTADGAFVSVDKAILFMGHDSGNTFDAWGHINNHNVTDLCPTAGTTITCLYSTGPSHGYGFGSTRTGGTLPPSGNITFGNGSGSIDNNCANVTIANMFVDGNQSTMGGGVDGLIVIWDCAGPTLVTNIRHLMSAGAVSAEGMFFPYATNNLTVQHSMFGSLGGGEAFQTNGDGNLGSGYTINNIVMEQYAFNPILISNIVYKNSQEYVQHTSVSYFGFLAGIGLGGGNCPETGVIPPGGTCNGDYNASVSNSLFWAGSNPLSVGGSVNDPTTSGGINKLNVTGNWLIGSHAEIDSCEWFPPEFGQGNCLPPNAIGMTINTNVDSSCNVSNWTGQPFNVINNSIIGSTIASINMSGLATPEVKCWLPGFTSSVLIPINVYNFVGQQNYLSSPSNQYITNANTINPTQSGNYCNGTVGTWSGGSACNTSGFTNAPTASFTLGNLGAGGIVPINSPTFTAQYGAVQWLAADCASPCSSPPSTPLSSDSRWSSNNGSFPNAAAVSYVPPVSLSGVAHGDTVYLWVMDSANHIAAATPQAVP